MALLFLLHILAFAPPFFTTLFFLGELLEADCVLHSGKTET